jgi:hypothetical protein
MRLRRSDIARLTPWSGSKESITSNGRNLTPRQHRELRVPGRSPQQRLLPFVAWASLGQSTKSREPRLGEARDRWLQENRSVWCSRIYAFNRHSVSAPTYPINRTATIHRCSRPYSNSAAPTPGVTTARAIVLSVEGTTMTVPGRDADGISADTNDRTLPVESTHCPLLTRQLAATSLDWMRVV